MSRFMSECEGLVKRHASLDDVRSRDGPIGHGTLFATIARLERLTLIEPTTNHGDRRAYRLTQLGLAAAGSVAAIQGEAHA